MILRQANIARKTKLAMHLAGIEEEKQSRHPVGQHGQHLFRLKGIGRPQMNAEIVGTFHTWVHREVQGEGGVLSGLESRRTDDRLRRSTTRPELDLRLTDDLKRLLATVGQGKDGADHCPHFDLPQVDLCAVQLEPGAAEGFGRDRAPR
jgi:hypothetical protein